MWADLWGTYSTHARQRQERQREQSAHDDGHGVVGIKEGEFADQTVRSVVELALLDRVTKLITGLGGNWMFVVVAVVDGSGGGGRVLR